MSSIQHVVIVLQSCRGRAIGQHALQRAEYLSGHFDTTVVSDAFPDDIPSSIKTLSIRPVIFNFMRRYCHVPNDLSFVISARKALLTLYTLQPFDLILCHSYSITRFVGEYFRKTKGIPFGMFMHGHIFTRPPGTYDVRMTKYYRWLAPGCYRNADIIFALSNSQRYLAIAAGADKKKVKVSPNGIHLRSLGINHERVDQNIDSKFSGEEIELLYVGRCTPEKGFHILLGACEQLLARKVRFRLTVVGVERMDQSLIDRINTTELVQCIELHKPVPRQDLGDFYLRTDILCVPSIDEAFGNVVLEGMISGCVVIGSATGGIPDIVEDQKSGYLFKNKDSRQLADTIAKCKVNKITCKEIVACAKLRARNQFNWENIFAQTLQDIKAEIPSIE